MRDAKQYGGWENDHISLARLGSLLSRRWRPIAATMAVAGAVTIIAIIIEGRVYTCTASFMPNGASGPSALSGVAAQFGIAVSGSDPTNSPEFYVDLTQSREVLGRIVDTDSAGSAKGSQLTDDESRNRHRAASIAALRKAVRAVANPRTGVVRLSVDANNQGRACMLTAKLLDGVNEFNLTHRQAQSEAERKFVEARLSNERHELRTAEDAVERFLQENRNIQGSPELKFQYERLQRELIVQQELYGVLSRALENATIEEARNTPVITIVERPVGSLRPMAGLFAQRLLMALVGALIVAVFVLVGAEYLSRMAPSRFVNENTQLQQTSSGQPPTTP